ncbi:TrbC/VirB2 family protein [Novosphingobium ovatum]|uniref:TrbC/VirB2 family protein n=1 Tax=Novosphingobium ovatum TaxID=1908523 RepID=UPI001D0F592A|nr:TrbC/VirB2 family protein [Novosphingobium ovatum]
MGLIALVVAVALIVPGLPLAHAQGYGGGYGAGGGGVDPAGSGPIIGAVRWVQQTLLGTVASVVAIIAVAFVGLMMLGGRMNWRHGVTVILGCFILFGAASIVAGIQSAVALGH